jgi:hypothetical protein
VPFYKNSTIDLEFEAHRLYSLIKNRPFPNAHVSAYDLAKNGFYYTGTGDNCRCHFCLLEVREWEAGDTARGEHERWNPDCPFLSKVGVTMNVEIGELEDERLDHLNLRLQLPPHRKFCRKEAKLQTLSPRSQADIARIDNEIQNFQLDSASLHLLRKVQIHS